MFMRGGKLCWAVWWFLIVDCNVETMGDLSRHFLRLLQILMLWVYQENLNPFIKKTFKIAIPKIFNFTQKKTKQFWKCQLQSKQLTMIFENFSIDIFCNFGIKQINLKTVCLIATSPVFAKSLAVRCLIGICIYRIWGYNLCSCWMVSKYVGLLWLLIEFLVHLEIIGNYRFMNFAVKLLNTLP